jgi:hypothetical protein
MNFTPLTRKKPLRRYLVYFFIIISMCVLSSVAGFFLVGITCVILYVIGQWISMGIGALFGTQPWELITFFRDGAFVFELSPKAFLLMESLARWGGIVGGLLVGLYYSATLIKKARDNR